VLTPIGPTLTLVALVQAALAVIPAPPEGTRATPALAAASDPAAPAPAADVSAPFGPPLHGDLTVLDPFAPPAQVWLPGHRGVDLAASQGDQVLAAGAGLVLWAGDLAGRGVVSVLLPDGRRTTYEPVDPVVAAGDLVEAGQVLGRMAPGVSHCGGAPPCLHWGLVTGRGVYLDPMSLLGPAGRPRLLPLGTGAP
jgi:murein DD-endopeptidase MepM/ murein hydrolase activator NlpD